MCVDVEKFKKRDSVQAFLHETYKLVCGIAQAPRPHIFCKDGFEMSVQAGDGSVSYTHLKIQKAGNGP